MVSKLLHFFGIFTVVSIKYSPISELWSSEVWPRQINGQTPLDKHVLKLRDVFRLHLTSSGYIAGQMRSSNNTFSYSLAQKHFLMTLKHAIFKYAHWHSKLTRDHAVHLTWTAATCWTLFFFECTQLNIVLFLNVHNWFTLAGTGQPHWQLTVENSLQSTQ